MSRQLKIPGASGVMTTLPDDWGVNFDEAGPWMIERFVDMTR
jgi:hypothetical protein